MMKRSAAFTVIIVFFAFTAASGCSGGSKEDIKSDESGKLQVFVSILPQKYFVEKIGGRRVSVEVMVLPGKSPTTYEPSPNQVTALSRADVFFSIDVPFENIFIPRISESLRSLRIIDTSSGIKKRTLAAHVHHEDEPAAGSLDPHIWLSPVLVKKQAAIIFNTLVEIDPGSEAVYRKGYTELLAELDGVHEEIREALAPYKGSILFVFHPSFGYFADEYGLNQVAVELEGREPTPSELEEIIEHAKDEGVRIIFAQPEFSKRSIEALANAIEGSVVVLNPLNPDYINSLKEIAVEIKKAYK
jgi:zinc transport system substrate-binding protein